MNYFQQGMGYLNQMSGGGGGGDMGGFGGYGGGGGGGGFNPLALFQQFDRNGDNTITEDDFVLMVDGLGLGGLGDFFVRQAFKRFDKNRNGRLDFNEVLAVLNSLQGGQ